MPRKTRFVIEGAGVFGDAWRGTKKIARTVARNIKPSQVLGYVPHPYAQVASKGLSLAGMGKTRKRRTRPKPRYIIEGGGLVDDGRALVRRAIKSGASQTSLLANKVRSIVSDAARNAARRAINEAARGALTLAGGRRMRGGNIFEDAWGGIKSAASKIRPSSVLGFLPIPGANLASKVLSLTGMGKRKARPRFVIQRKKRKSKMRGGNIFEDAWGGIKSAANTVARNIRPSSVLGFLPIPGANILSKGLSLAGMGKRKTRRGRGLPPRFIIEDALGRRDEKRGRSITDGDVLVSEYVAPRMAKVKKTTGQRVRKALGRVAPSQWLDAAANLGKTVAKVVRARSTRVLKPSEWIDGISSLTGIAGKLASHAGKGRRKAGGSRSRTSAGMIVQPRGTGFNSMPYSLSGAGRKRSTVGMVR